MSRANKIHTIAIIGCIGVIGFVISFAIIAYTPLSNLIPGYPTSQTRQQEVETALLIDSLQSSIRRWEMYSENLRRICEGKTPIQFDSIVPRMEREQKAEVPLPSKADSTLRAIVGEAERFDISDKNKRSLEIEGLHFFKPLSSGVILEGYSESLHPYVLVGAKEGSRVTSVLDGSVIFTSWSAREGWCMVIQHENGIISIYKNNSSLLKKVTDHVSAGGAIAILPEGRSSSSESPALHFELWQNGAALDPSEYINF